MFCRDHSPRAGEEVWLIAEFRSEETKYYFSNLPASASLKKVVSAIKARWSCEQMHQQMKEELGLDHFEGRTPIYKCENRLRTKAGTWRHGLRTPTRNGNTECSTVPLSGSVAVNRPMYQPGSATAGWAGRRARSRLSRVGGPP